MNAKGRTNLRDGSLSRMSPHDASRHNPDHPGGAWVVTGAGGSVGSSLARHLLWSRPEIVVRAVERSEIAIAALLEIAEFEPRLHVVMGDVSDLRTLEDAVRGAQVVVHCAALKRIDVGAIFPGEMASQNVQNFVNVVKIAKRHSVERVMVCSSDKAATPSSVMAASKLLIERIAH